jgi:hypothetical protein
MRRRSAGVTLVVLLAVPASPASTQTADHLQCYKITTDGHVKGSADVEPAGGTPPRVAGCRLRGPVAYCLPASTANVQTTPPAGASAGAPATPRLCYKAKCPTRRGTVAATDRFGTFAVRIGRSLLLCTPSDMAPSTTSTAVTPTTTPTGTTLVPPCSGATFPFCGGTCPAGLVCQAASVGDTNIPASLQSYCTCVPAALPCPSSASNPTCAGGLGVCPTGQVCASAVLPIAAVCGCASP